MSGNEHRAARKRIKNRRREHKRRGTDLKMPRGLSRAQKAEWYQRKREWLNYIPGKSGQPDREFGTRGIDGKPPKTEAELDVERKMQIARELKNAEMAGKMLGRRLVRQVLRGEGDGHGSEDDDRVDGKG